MREHHPYNSKKKIFWITLLTTTILGCTFLWFFKVSPFLSDMRTLGQMTEFDRSTFCSGNIKPNADGEYFYPSVDNPWIQNQLKRHPGIVYNPQGDGLGPMKLNMDHSKGRLIAWFDKPTPLNRRVILHSSLGRTAISEPEFQAKYPWATTGENPN